MSTNNTIKALLLCSIALAACSPSESVIQTAIAQTQAALPLATEPIFLTDTPSATQTNTPVSMATKQPTELPKPTSVNDQVGKVVRILDGDTIDVDIDGTVFRVRYIGINTPEKGEVCFNEATTANVALIYQQTVRLVKDVSETDQYQRLLRYVYVGETFVNGALVKQGYAEAVEYPPDTSQASYLNSLEAVAKAAGLGCYALGGFSQPLAATAAPVPPTTVIQPTQPIIQPTQPVIANCDPSYPSVCIPAYPPDLDCGQISFRRFAVLPPDPHGFDRDNDGIGCESG